MKVRLVINTECRYDTATITLDTCTVHEFRSAQITFNGRQREMRILKESGYILLQDGGTYQVIRPADDYTNRYFWHPAGERKVVEKHSSHLVLRYSLADWERSKAASYNSPRYSRDFCHAVRVVFDPEANWAFEPAAAISSFHYRKQAALAYFKNREDDEPQESIPVVYEKDERPCYINGTFWLRPDYQLQPTTARVVYDLILTHKDSPIRKLPAARLLRWPYVLSDGRMVLVPTGTLPVERVNVEVLDYAYNHAYVLRSGG